jgi:restriction system protein
MAVLIEADLPQRWQDLEAGVARILADCGYDVEVGKNVKLARGDANIDVWADDHSLPPNVIAVECKHWKDSVPKTVVHSFRTVVEDSGANLGLIVSGAGFESGAVEAAAYSNVRLLTWEQFQEMFAERWYKRFMLPTLAGETDALNEYTEFLNSRILRKLDALAPERQEKHLALRQTHLALASLAFKISAQRYDAEHARMPSLPLRRSDMVARLGESIPDDVLDAPALRPLMDALVERAHIATAEFDEVFGERA